MSTSSASPPPSIFWPLLFLVVSLGAREGFHLYDLNQDRLATRHDIRQLVGQGQKAMAAKNRFMALIGEIRKTATQDAAASQLLTEFKIPAQSAPAASSGG